MWSREGRRRKGRGAEHPTPNTQHPTSNGNFAHTLAPLGVGCWVLDVGCLSARAGENAWAESYRRGQSARREKRRSRQQGVWESSGAILNCSHPPRLERGEE